MKYRSLDIDKLEDTGRIGVLVTNLGTPDAPETGALRRYLKEFLSDPRVVEVPRLLWWLILNLVILRIRPARSAKAYKTVWTDEGSPLMLHTTGIATALRSKLAEQFGDEVRVEFAMRYGNPSISEVADKMLAKGVNKLLVLPLFPQYSGATGGSTFDAIAAELSQRRQVPTLRFIDNYHDHADYIGALALSIRAYQAEHGTPEKLLFSYHGVPKRYCDEGDPYYCQCHNTTRLVAELLDLDENSYMTVFQSRFGREEWLQPYADETLKRLPAEGVKSIQVICPGFSADCLETLEEIGVENRDYFLEAGGSEFGYIPCLNSDAGHVAALAQLLEEELAGWVEKRLD
jgi:protoporphyrin/coproporphyrin ferrochelatase